MIKLGIVMDPISEINIKKDSSFAMLLAAQSRGYELFYMEMKDLAMVNGKAMATMRGLSVQQDEKTGLNWANLSILHLPTLM